jgi:hypothetical protein
MHGVTRAPISSVTEAEFRWNFCPVLNELSFLYPEGNVHYCRFEPFCDSWNGDSYPWNSESRRTESLGMKVCC